MKKLATFIGVAVGAFCLGACASTTDGLARATATSVGGNLAPESVTVSNVARGATSVKWDAATPNGNYACSADDMVRRPYCVKR